MRNEIWRRKKSKLTISGNPKKSINNIELAKSQNKNSVVIEKKPSRFSNRSPFKRSSGARPNREKILDLKVILFQHKDPKIHLV